MSSRCRVRIPAPLNRIVLGIVKGTCRISVFVRGIECCIGPSRLQASRVVRFQLSESNGN